MAASDADWLADWLTANDDDKHIYKFMISHWHISVNSIDLLNEFYIFQKAISVNLYERPFGGTTRCTMGRMGWNAQCAMSTPNQLNPSLHFEFTFQRRSFSVCVLAENCDITIPINSTLVLGASDAKPTLPLCRWVCGRLSPWAQPSKRKQQPNCANANTTECNEKGKKRCNIWRAFFAQSSFGWAQPLKY